MNTSDATVETTSFLTDVELVLTQPWYPYFIAAYLLLWVILFVGNVLVIIAYWTTVQLQTPPNLIIFNLSLIDSLVPIFCLPWMIFNYTQFGLDIIVRDKWACLTMLWVSMTNATASMMALLFLSLERFIACFFPFTYYVVVTEKSAKVVNVLTWVIACCLHMIPMLGLHTWQPGYRCFTMYVHNPVYNSLVASGTRTIILILTAVVNIAVCIVAFKKKRVGVVQNPPTSQATDQPSPTNDFKLTKMLLTVVGVFYLCWAPYLALNTLYTMRRGYVPTWFECLLDFSKLGIGLNSTLNPLIYARKDSKFRNAFKKILFKRSPENSVGVQNSSTTRSERT